MLTLILNLSHIHVNTTKLLNNTYTFGGHKHDITGFRVDCLTYFCYILNIFDSGNGFGNFEFV